VYAKGPGHVDAFLYSPIFWDVTRPLGVLPWPMFWLFWAAMEGAALAWLLKPLPVRWSVPLWLLCAPELMNGNIYIFLAVAVAIGMRHPAGWAFPVLTKVISGVGLLWFVARGEWRRLALAVGVVLAIVGTSYAFQPGEWTAWVEFLMQSRNAANDGQSGLLLRCVLAAAVVVFAARASKPWLVPVAIVVANPIMVLTMLTVLAAIPRLQGMAEPPGGRWRSAISTRSSEWTSAEPARSE
jgi:hypothetical protein